MDENPYKAAIDGSPGKRKRSDDWVVVLLIAWGALAAVTILSAAALSIYFWKRGWL
jgi:hypothetical protein